MNITSDTAITVKNSGSAPNARNKTLQESTLTDNGSIVAINNVNGYGLQITGATTFSAASHISVANATASNLVPGVTLSGVVSDSGGFTLVKSGLGTLALTNSGNTFGGAGQTIDVLNGILAASSDGALGDSNNTITLEVDGTTGTGFRAIGSFSTARTFLLNAANNAIEVTAGNTLTLTTPFTLGAAANTLTKNDNGVLELAANNTGWTGAVTINAGAILASNNNGLGSGAVTINNAVGSALQLTGGVSIANAITLVTNGGSGYDTQGVIQSVSGSNTVTGLITQNSGSAFTYGASAGATLNINGNIAASNSATFYAGAGGVVNLNSAYGNGGAGGPGFNKIGPGTLNVTSSQSAVTSAINVNAGTMTISGSGVKFGGTGAVTIAPTATLFVDDTGTATANRLGGRPMTLQGGTLSYLGNAVTSTETLGVLTAARPGSTILADSNGGTSTITFASLTQNANSTLNFVSATAALGSANNKIIFTTAPTLTNSLLQRATLNGSDFVTYGANGIAPFTTYNAGSSTNINSVTATTGTADVTATMTTRNLTANRTINAMRLSDPAGVTIGATGAAFVAGGNTPAQLALSAGAILATGSTTHTISVPVLAMPIASGTTTVEAFYSVTSGTSLEIKSAITGNAGWVKNGPGTLTLTPPTSPIAGRGASTISGNATINDGTVILNGGNNTLAATNFLILGPTGTVDLNGNSQLARLMTDAAVENGGGIVTGSAASSTLVTLQDNVARNWAGQMTGALSFLRTGDNTLTMYSDNTYTGKTLLAGATTTLLDGARLSGTSDIEIVYATLNITNTGTKDLTDRIKDTAAISLRGGTINFAGRAQTASSETLGAVTLNKGLSFITSTAGGTGVNSADLTLTSLTQTPGTYATINFNTANLGQMGSFGRILIGTLNGVATDPTTVGLGLTNNIIGGWAEVQNDFATYIPGLGVAALGANGALQYDLINTFNGSLITDNVRLTATTTIPNGGKTVNAVSMTGSNIALNFTAGTDILNIVSGGLIGPNNNQTIGTTAIRGVLTAGGTASSGTNPLYIYNRANTLTVNSQIVDTATAIGSGTAKTALVLNASGGAITIGNGTNSYTGGTIVNGGTVNLNVTTGSVAIPLATNPADSLIINGGTVTMQNFAGQIDPAAIVTLNGNAVLNLFGANTLGGFIFRDDGGGTGGTGVNSNSGTLTVNGNIVSTTANVGSTSVLNGRYDFGATQRTLDISAIRFNGQELAALLSDFNIQGITGSSGGFLKTGDGVLQFNAQANYTGITDVAQGRVQVGATNGGSRFSNLNLQSGTALNLNGLSTIWGSLTGTGFVFNSSASTTAQTLTVGFDQTDFTFGGTFMRFNDATPGTTNLTKIGAGNMSLTAAGSSSTNLGVLTVNHGTVTYKDSGSRSFLTSATVVNEGGTLTLDNSNATSSANLNNRLNSTTGVTLNGGTFNLLGRDSTATTETVSGVLTLGPSASSINLTAGAGGTAVMTFTSLTQNAGSTAIVTGTNLGTDTKLLFTTAPTLVPATTGILARVAVGTDFATYNATNGVIAFTGYTTPTDINAAAATATIKVDGTTAVRDLTLPRTINAVNVIDNSVTIGSTGAYLLPTQGWTVTSGGVLVNGNSATISSPVLAMGAEGIFRVNGSALEVTSSITGTGGITKTGSGSMTLTGPQSYTGQTALNLGTLTLNGGKNTILVAPSGTIPTVADLQVNAGVFDLNGNNQAVRTILNSNTLSFIAGEITNSSATAATLTTAMNANSTFGGQISGNLSLVRSGNNTLTLSDAQTYTGATIIRGGGLQLLDNGSLATSSITLNFGALTLNNQNLNALANLNPVRIPATTPVTMTGGTFVVSPGGSVDNTMTLNTLTILAGGANTFTANGVTGGTNVINIGNLVLPTGAATTLHFNTDPGLATNGALPASGGAQVLLTKINGVTPTNNAFLGANVIINNGEYGVYNTVQGVIRYGGTAANGQTIPAYAAALASGNNLPNNISSTGADVAISANTTIGALRLTGGATRAITFAAGTEVLNLALGGLLRDNVNNATNIGTTALRGVLTSGGTATTGTTDLVEFHNQNTLTINSVIADNGLGNKTRFVKSGPAGTTFTAANTYTGGTVVNSGTLTINATAGAGTIVIPAGGITLNNANLTMSTNQGQIDSSNAVTINGAGTLTLTGTNTLNSVTINGIGGSSTPTVAVGTLLTLSSATPITVTNDNYSFTPTISGTELNLVDGATISTAGESPDDLIISAKISTAASTTPLVKTGTGSLVLSSNTSAFSNGFNLDQGSLIFANNSAGTPPAITAGPVGTGTLTIGNGTAVMSDGTARTIGNAVSVTGDFTFGTLDAMNARANSGNNLTLSGTTTLAAGAHTITVNGLLMTGTISGQLTGGTDLTKDGPGTLVLSNATNNYGGTTTVNAGTLQIGTAGSIPDASRLAVNTNGYFNLNGLAETVGSISGAGVITNTGAAQTLTVGGDSTTDGDFTGHITNQANALSLTMTGTGTQTISGVENSYTGVTTVNGGTLAVVKLADGGLVSSIGKSTNGASNLVINGGTLKYTGTGATDGTTDRQFTLGTSGGTIDASGAAGSALNFTSTSAVTLSGTNTARTLTLAGSNTDPNTIAASLGDNGTGVTSLVKDGAGTWSVTANNGFSGGTTVNAGTLLVNNTPSLSTDSGTGTGIVTVNTGGTLGGNGTIAGDTTIGSGGILSPGSAAGTNSGTLTFQAGLTVAGNGVAATQLAFNYTNATGNGGFTDPAGWAAYVATNTSGGVQTGLLAGTSGQSNDLVNLVATSGTPALVWGDGGKISLSQLGSTYTWMLGDVLNLIDWTTVYGSSIGGTFDASNAANWDLPSLGLGLSWDTTQFMSSGAIAVVPEPSRVLLLLLGLAGLFFRRRRR